MTVPALPSLEMNIPSSTHIVLNKSSACTLESALGNSLFGCLREACMILKVALAVLRIRFLQQFMQTL